MASVQNLEFELQNLFKEKKFSEIILEITTKTQENERTAGLFVLLGISRISLNKRNKDQVELALSDFKKGYLKELTSENSLNALVNLVLASVILSDFENTDVDFDEIKNLDGQGLIISSTDDEFDFVSRYFCPKYGINEDPVTGSAHTTLIPYWSEKLNSEELVAKQVSERSGVLYCKNKDTRVLIAGKAVLYMKGEIDLS